MVRLIEEVLHCWAQKDRAGAFAFALGTNHLSLEKDADDESLNVSWMTMYVQFPIFSSSFEAGG